MAWRAFADGSERKFAGAPGNRAPIIARTCIAAVPPGDMHVKISQLGDPISGGDGWDTSCAILTSATVCNGRVCGRQSTKS